MKEITKPTDYYTLQLIKILNIENNNPEHHKLLYKSTNILDALLASPVFEKEFLKLKMVPKVRQKNGEYIELNMSNADVLAHLKEDIEFNVEFFYRDSPVLGMASEEKNRIRFNTKYFQPVKVNTIASTVLHEYLHILGFDHKGSKDYDSVPYAAGNLALRLLRKYPYEGGRLKLVNRGFPLCFLKTTKWTN